MEKANESDSVVIKKIIVDWFNLCKKDRKIYLLFCILQLSLLYNRKNLEKGNLKAGTRARKVASELSKTLKTLRKTSQESDSTAKRARAQARRDAGVPAKVFPGRKKTG